MKWLLLELPELGPFNNLDYLGKMKLASLEGLSLVSSIGVKFCTGFDSTGTSKLTLIQ
jgi:hypothetical protein